jgi:ribosome-associated protein
MKEIVIKDTIKLDQFLKWAGITNTGGQSKLLIQSNQVKVNGEIENRRGKKIVAGDIIEVDEIGKFKVVV